MLDSAVEVISQAASSSLFVFCFCNLIIAVILVGSKSKSSIEGSCAPASSMPTCKSNTNETRVKAESPSNHREERAVAEPEDACTQCNIEIEDKGYNQEEDEDHDDELKMRIEDFIAKVNREWQAENLRAKATS
ncbi:uncharacterized protein LOC116190019 [Punica granatum]|uniref:Uncharacterized protein LOC116190019 n=1 Tax=Punica granatum TaxID=22663 RepID=A0A6P8BX23_PUNGR|nr:uncharacterized protein LOC116190019 [Punica granatum]